MKAPRSQPNSSLSSISSGKAAQLTFKNLCCDRDDNLWMRLSHSFFPGAALAENQHRHIEVCQELRLPMHLAHGWTGGEEEFTVIKFFNDLSRLLGHCLR